MEFANDHTDPIDIAHLEALATWIGLVIGEPINDVRVEPLTSVDSASGVPLYRISATSADSKHNFVAKIASPNSDWIARATHDETVREAALFRAGLPNLLPPEISWPALATRPTADNRWILLMSDLASTQGTRLVPPGDDQLDATETARHLCNLAALHRSFLGKQSAFASVALCDLRDWILLLGPATIEREWGGNDPVTPHLQRGWETFFSLAPRKVAQEVERLLIDPTDVINALTQGPMTLLHGDFKFGNLGLQQGTTPTTIALDWSLALWGPPELDLAWFLAVNSARLPFDKLEATEIYREALGIERNDNWVVAVEVALLAGGVLRLGWAKALGATSTEPQVAKREKLEMDFWLQTCESALRNLNAI